MNNYVLEGWGGNLVPLLCMKGKCVYPIYKKDMRNVKVIIFWKAGAEISHPYYA